MSRKLYFTWALSEQVNCMEEITQEKINNQKKKLEDMLSQLTEKLKSTPGVKVYEYSHIDCNGKYRPCDKQDNLPSTYYVDNRMQIILEKTGRKTTWNAVYAVINTVKAAYYRFI